MSDQQPLHSVVPLPECSDPVTVDLAELVLAGSPRLAGESETHIQLLVDAGTELPAILVHRPTMRVLDGMHRVRAARLRGEEAIRAVFFDGDTNAAFVLAVQANTTHGLPLTLADRRAAAERIVRSQPAWSDRAIASVTGLSAVTVRALRERATDRIGHLNARMGLDGRIRPLDATDGRRRAAELLSDRPDASLREVARAAGVSVGTVRDVRQRIRTGQDPVPSVRYRHRRPVRAARPPESILAGLKRDPSLRYSERGRTVVRWLDARVISSGDWSRVVTEVPPHCALLIAELAAGCARAWAQLADELTGRAAPADPPGAAPGEHRSGEEPATPAVTPATPAVTPATPAVTPAGPAVGSGRRAR
jgi:ParB-like chromosome segregation protein Spo0J